MTLGSAVTIILTTPRRRVQAQAPTRQNGAPKQARTPVWPPHGGPGIFALQRSQQQLIGCLARSDTSLSGTKLVVEAMYRDGVLISRIGRNDEVLKIRPPLAFQSSDVEVLITKLGRVIAAP